MAAMRARVGGRAHRVLARCTATETAGPCLVRLTISAALLACGSGAHAQAKQLVLSVGTRHESNFFRANEAAKADLPHDGADLVTYLNAALAAQTRLGTTDLTIAGSVGQSLYRYNDRYDMLDYNAQLAASRVGSRDTLDLSLSQTRRRVALEDLGASVRSVQDLTRLSLDGSRDILGLVRLVGAASYERSAVSTTGVGRSAFNLNGNRTAAFSGGIGYFSPTGNSIRLEYVTSASEGLADGTILSGGIPITYRADARQQSARLRLDYSPSALTRLQGSIGYTRHNDRSVLDADFAGLTADAAVTWSPLPSIRIEPRFRRSFSSENRVFSNGVKVTSYSVTARAKLYDRMAVSAYANEERRSFRYDLRTDAPLTLSRNERTRRLGATIAYTTSFDLELRLTAEHLERRATLRNFEFSANAVMLTLSRGFDF